MLILAIESSCDETSASVVRDGRSVLSNVIATSRSAFEKSGGVIPEEAARRQVECMVPVIRQALSEANVGKEQIDLIAVTKGPGLSGSLLVGTTAARALASLWGKPLIGVHHTLGHLASTLLELGEEPAFPAITLSASGGHTDLLYRTAHARGFVLGTTRDDAAGEAFDKGAALLGLPYPGGPAIQEHGAKGKRDAFRFPLPLNDGSTLDFSFSGLKTALKYAIRDLEAEGKTVAEVLPDIAASYEHAVCRHLAARVEESLGFHPEVREVHIVGGVSANVHLRSLVQAGIGARVLRFPVRLSYCTDNAAMIAAAAYTLYCERGERACSPFTTGCSLRLEDVLAAH